MFSPPSIRLFALVIWLLCSYCLPLQAALVPVVPPQKQLKKTTSNTKKQRWRLFKQRYKTIKQSTKTTQQSSLSFLAWFLIIWVLWWMLMATLIVVGLVQGIPALWITGIVLAVFPFVLLFFLALILWLGFAFAKPRYPIQPAMEPELE